MLSIVFSHFLKKFFAQPHRPLYFNAIKWQSKRICPSAHFFSIKAPRLHFPEKQNPRPTIFSIVLRGGCLFSDPTISLLRGGLLVFFRDFLRLFLDRPKMFDDRVVTAPDYCADGFAIIAL